MIATTRAKGGKSLEALVVAADADAWAAGIPVGAEAMAGGAAAEKAMNSGRRCTNSLGRQKRFRFR